MRTKAKPKKRMGLRAKRCNIAKKELASTNQNPRI
jgi:hypothetical protein